MAIEIYNVVLLPEIIVGVGPLLRVVTTDPISIARKELRLQFDLYCTHYRTVITTDVLSFDSLDKERSDKEAAWIREAWENIRYALANDLAMETVFPCLPKTMPGV